MPEIWKNVDKRTIADSLIEILRTTWPCSRHLGQVNFPPVKAECLKNGILVTCLTDPSGQQNLPEMRLDEGGLRK
jgi:hypothetical protein